jgi:hypothetical protein
MSTNATQLKPTITGQWATPFKVCELCKESRPASEFVRCKGRLSNRICQTCWHTRKEEALEHFSPAGEPAQARPLKNNLLQALMRRRFSKRGEINGMTAEERTVKVAKLPDRIAAIIGKTFAEQGDSATLADDEALMKIRDYLNELDETLIPRNKNKRLSKG